MSDPLERARVTQRLSEASTSPIVVLRGAAGSGKSVALRQFLQRADEPYLIYDVGPERDTLARFVRGLADAIGDLAPGARLSFAGAYERAMQSRNPARDLSAWLHEHVKLLRIVIAIDNLHHVESDPQSVAFLTRLIEMSTPGLRWILSCRSGDLFPFPSWMAFDDMDVPIEDSDLAFTLEDIAALGARSGGSITARQCVEVSECTQGWATGVALLLSSGALDSEAIAERGPVRAYPPLIERALAACGTWELRALLSTCYLPELTGTFLSANAAAATADAVARLYARAPYLFVESGGALRYHDMLASALRSRLGDLSPRDRATAVELAAQALRQRHLFAEALALYLESDSLDPIAHILEYHGVELIERGHADLIETALLAMERARHPQSSISIALRAIVESRRGRFDTAESWFNQALARAADDDLRMIEIKYLYACDLMLRYRLDCIPLLQSHAQDETLPRDLRAKILSALAVALVLAEKPESAHAAIDEALALTKDLENEIRALVLARASFVYQLEPEKARGYALAAAESAVADSAFSAATSAYSVLYAMADAAEEPRAAFEYLSLLRENGLKSGNLTYQFYFLACTLDIEAESGDRDALARTDAALDSFESNYHDATSKEALLPANALRATWSGNFDHAYNLLAPTAATQAVSDRIALRFAEVALYAAAALRMKDCDDAMVRARSAMAEVEEPNNRYRRAQILGALALAIAGRSREADAYIDEVRGAGLPQRLTALLEAAESVRDRCRGARNQGRLVRAVSGLRTHDFGGYARLCEALPFHAIFSARVAALTESERAVLARVVDGNADETAAERLRETLDCESMETMRGLAIRTGALHAGKRSEVPA